MIYILLGIAAILTSTISGIIGMGGGVLLLTSMTFLLPYKVSIPIHGIVQLSSNSARAFLLRSHINKPFLISFTLGAPIGTFFAFKILSLDLDEKYYYLLLSLLIIYVIFKPRKLPSIKLGNIGWFSLGVISAIFSPLLGATGPMIAIFYVRDDLPKEEIIATKAAQQSLLHFLKIPLFLSLSFNYFKYINLTLIMVLGVFIGTYFGIGILKKINERIFRLVFQIVLLLSACRLLYKFYSEVSL